MFPVSLRKKCNRDVLLILYWKIVDPEQCYVPMYGKILKFCISLNVIPTASRFALKVSKVGNTHAHDLLPMKQLEFGI